MSRFRTQLPARFPARDAVRLGKSERSNYLRILVPLFSPQKRGFLNPVAPEAVSAAGAGESRHLRSRHHYCAFLRITSNSATLSPRFPQRARLWIGGAR